MMRCLRVGDRVQVQPSPSFTGYFTGEPILNGRTGTVAELIGHVTGLDLWAVQVDGCAFTGRYFSDELRPLGVTGSDGQAQLTDSSPLVRTCRVCGCTDRDCRRCIARTGVPCYWVQQDLCSACVGAGVPHA